MIQCDYKLLFQTCGAAVAIDDREIGKLGRGSGQKSDRD
jgi:hypothetical protein